MLLLGFAAACQRPVPPTPLKHILARGELTVIVRKGADGFYWTASDFETPGPSGGFEYELVRLLASHLGVSLKIRTAEGGARMLADLMAGRGDMIAGAAFPASLGQEAQLLFSRPFLRPLIQPIFAPGLLEELDTAKDSTREPRFHVVHPELLGDQLEGPAALNGLVAHPDLGVEGIFRGVAAGRLPAALADEHITRRLAWDYPRIRQGQALPRRRTLAWALPPHGHELQRRIDRFLTRMEKSGRLAHLVRRHFPGQPQDRELGIAAFHQRIRRRLPKYLDTIRQAAEQYNFDWELIAALTYQESLWQHGAVSRAGARGLMQLLPDTAKSLGVVDVHNPRENIRGGVRYLNAYYNFYDRAAPKDRLKIALAAYNVGIGHVLDARNLARRRGLDPNRWSSLEETLLLLSKPEYYRRSKYGYCRGSEPVNYVNRIMIYRGILQRRVLTIDPGTALVPG